MISDDMREERIQPFTYLRDLLFDVAVENLVQHIYWGFGLDGNACPHALGMYVSN